ncbi:MAG: DUF1015 domain-containing protein [Candidatus Thermoplasmatota archaeon]|nr:DUF1015 domain-containing protein [Candidatus Thermoplasmatota archaeon]
MVEVFPFNGITYNKEKIKKLDDVMAPPYDIISEEQQKELYNKHPKNYVRLILNKIEQTDDDDNNRYTRAKKLYDEWLSDSTLIKSDKAVIYVYKIEYILEGSKKTMNGFFVLLKIDPDYKCVKAHERTLSKPKADRLNLTRACKSNLEPIQLLYIDEKDKIRKAIDKKIKTPIIDVKGYDGFKHKLWRLEDTETISMIQNELKNNILFIADGHHRYQTSINYANEMKEKTGDTSIFAPFNFIMVVLANMFDEGLSILPTHRFVKKSDVNIKDCLIKLNKYFIIEEKIFDKKDAQTINKKIIEDIKTKDKHKFALYTKDKYFVLTLKDEKIMDEFAPDRSKTWRTLDVSILHKIVLEQAMGINQDNLEDHVKYTRVDEEAIKFVNQGKYDFSVLMNATKIKELKAIADSGEYMPQKSTYFLPKMLSGLVAYKME